MPRRHNLPRRSRKPNAEAHGMMHPIGRSIAIARMRASLRTMQLHLHLMPDGADARHVLPDAAWLLGLGCEIALAHHAPDGRVLHGALRGVAQMAVQGCRWQSQQALAIDQAVQRSQALFEAHTETACMAQEGARRLADAIEQGTVRMSDVAGAEIYREAAIPKHHPHQTPA